MMAALQEVVRLRGEKEARTASLRAEAGELKCEAATSALSMFRTRQICGRTLNMCYQVTSGRPPPASS